jgi:hypothetical protein
MTSWLTRWHSTAPHPGPFLSQLSKQPLEDGSCKDLLSAAGAPVPGSGAGRGRRSSIQVGVV